MKGFIREAHLGGYAAGQAASPRKEADGSTTIEYRSGEFSFHDNFFGGEPYGGREVVSWKGHPVWMLVYYGRVDEAEVPGQV
jgi:hypothetical protein